MPLQKSEDFSKKNVFLLFCTDANRLPWVFHKILQNADERNKCIVINFGILA